jgi:tetratricopeptide (TPR) repeat protein
LEIAPKNTKNIKRKANLLIHIGHLGEAVELLTKCINLEPRDPSHNTDLINVNNLIKEKDRLDEHCQKKNYDKVEEISEKILKDAPEFTTIKVIYLTALLANCKLDKAGQFLKNKVHQDEKEKYEELEFIEAQFNYYQGK